MSSLWLRLWNASMVKLLVQAQEYQRQAGNNWNLGDRLLSTDIWLIWWCICSTMCTGAGNLPLQAVTFCLSTGFTWRKQPHGFALQGSHQPQLLYEYLGNEAVMQENNAGVGAWDRFHLHTRPDCLKWGKERRKSGQGVLNKWQQHCQCVHDTQQTRQPQKMRWKLQQADNWGVHQKKSLSENGRE